MKKYFMGALSFSLVMFLFSITVQAQVGNVLKKVKQKTENKINGQSGNKTGNKSDSSVNKDENTKDNKTASSAPDTIIVGEKSAAAAPSIKAYSKYDFVPGEKVVGFEDFMQGSIGDFPTGWNTNASAEIVTVEGKPGRWLMLTKPGVFIPEFTDNLPADFTLEFDILRSKPFGSGTTVVLKLSLTQLQSKDQPQNWSMSDNRYTMAFTPGNTGSSVGMVGSEIRKNGTSESSTSNETKNLTDNYNPAHVSIWRQKERVRVYINEEKVWDVPKALAAEAKLNSLIFSLYNTEPTSQYFLGNIRLAVGAPDTRNKFVTEGKWVSHGILFNVNSAEIKSESYGSLKEIANVLKESPDVKVKIVGHTDADGTDAANLDLSKRRAAAVKEMLAKEFGIDEGRMQTDGLGESKPIDKNDSPAGKANNRRVEFIKV